MHTAIHPITQLDLVRADAAARQERAQRYRFQHEQVTDTPDIRLLAILAAVALAVTIGLYGSTTTPAVADTTDEAPTTASFEDPLPYGYLEGHADGWYEPGTDHTQVLGVVVGRTEGVPHNVR